MENYYAKHLHAAKLFQVYQTDIERVRQYLDAEIAFVRRALTGSERVLELGAGYGRILRELAPFAASLVGIDISADSVALGEDYLRDAPNCSLRTMDAHHLTFGPEFDVVLCLQNALSAMKGDPSHLVQESLRVLVPGGKAFFSSYSPRFWDHRLAWFFEQEEKGLLGPIDRENTRDGVIVCQDGFRATTFGAEDLERLAQATGRPYGIEEVDASSVFLVLEK